MSNGLMSHIFFARVGVVLLTICTFCTIQNFEVWRHFVIFIDQSNFLCCCIKKSHIISPLKSRSSVFK